MLTLTGLWMPVLVSAVVVFVLSSLVHMVLKWDNSDYRAFANEDEVRAVIRKSNPAPGAYVLPHGADAKDMGTPELQQKYHEGPVGVVFVSPSGAPSMGRSLLQWFLLTVVVGIFAGYVASRLLPAGAGPMPVLQVVATVTFLAYAAGTVQDAIWMGKTWRSVAKYVVDGLIYGLATGAVFASLWP